MRRRTIDLLGIGIVAIGCLTVASYVSEWWRAESGPSVPPIQSAGWDDASGTMLQFGTMQHALHRQTIQGSRDQALTRLAENCRDAASSGKNAISDNGPDPIPAEEQRLLDLLQARVPDDVFPDGARRHNIDGLLPMVVITGDPTSVDTQSSASTAAKSRRVLSWGIAVPVDESQWSLMTLQPAGKPSAENAKSPSLPFPTEARRTIDITGHDGSRLVSFRGDGPGKQWVRELDRQFLHEKWKPLRSWSQSQHGNWSASYVQDDDSQRTQADLQLAREPGGDWVGILQMTPRH
ncbi:hypothetical protein [Maioricimonas rarisocia]|nr:hypothetical protein [Maioricimonas rarisocia]